MFALILLSIASVFLGSAGLVVWLISKAPTIHTCHCKERCLREDLAQLAGDVSDQRIATRCRLEHAAQHGPSAPVSFIPHATPSRENSEAVMTARRPK